MTRVQSMSGIEKAATILNVLDKDMAGRLLQKFDIDDLERITSISKTLEPVDSQEFSILIEEFASNFADGLNMLGSSREIGGLLETVLTPDQVAQIGADKQSRSSTPVWDNEEFTRIEILEPIIKTEHPQLAAVILSKLDSVVSSSVIATLDDIMRNDILLRMLEMKPIEVEVMEIMEDHFRSTIIENDEAAKGAEARARMAAIINNMEKEQADRFLQELTIEEPEEALRLKKMLFAFEDLPVLLTKDRMVLFDNVPTDISILAMNGLDPELKELILSSFGTRVRKMIESELSNAGEADPKEVNKARRKIANMALDLAAKGEITIIMSEES